MFQKIQIIFAWVLVYNYPLNNKMSRTFYLTFWIFLFTFNFNLWKLLNPNCVIEVLKLWLPDFSKNKLTFHLIQPISNSKTKITPHDHVRLWLSILIWNRRKPLMNLSHPNILDAIVENWDYHAWMCWWCSHSSKSKLD
jgi:hypothetical protein